MVTCFCLQGQGLLVLPLLFPHLSGAFVDMLLFPGRAKGTQLLVLHMIGLLVLQMIRLLIQLLFLQMIRLLVLQISLLSSLLVQPKTKHLVCTT